MNRSWEFEDDNMRRMYDKNMTEKDHEDFPVRVLAEEYETLALLGTEGLMKYFYKENEDDAKIGRKRLKFFNAMHSLLLFFVYGCLIYFFIKLFWM